MIPDSVVPILQQLAEQFRTTVDHLWGVLVYQAKLEAIVSIVQYLIVFALTAFMWQMTRLAVRKIGDGKWNSDNSIPPLAMGWAVVVAIWIVFLAELPNVVTKIFNPEYWALMQILKEVVQ